MKKIAILITILLLFPIISAVEFDMKSNFSQGETLITRVSGNFINPVLKSNIKFYRGHVPTSITFDVAKIDEEFYIYGLLANKNQGDYSIRITDVSYRVGNQVSEEDLEKSFSITNETAVFSINPGFIVARDDFFIEVQNLKDSKITVSADDDGKTSSVELKSGEIKKMNFELGDITGPVVKTIELSSGDLKYEVPVYLYIEETKKQRDFEFQPKEVTISMAPNTEKTRIIYLNNIGKEDLEDITLSVSSSLEPYISLSKKEISELDEEEAVKIEVRINSKDEELLEGNIIAETSDLSTFAIVALNVLQDFELLPEDNQIGTDFTSTKTCKELQGKTYKKETQECIGESVYAKDGVCCLGTRRNLKTNYLGIVIGVIIFAGVIFVAWLLLKKYKGVRRTINLLKIAKGKK